jgi:hypothetical protein
MTRAWAAGLLLLLLFAAAPGDAASTRVLVLHDVPATSDSGADYVLARLHSLLGHFDCSVATAPAESYQSGAVESHDAIIYLGLRADADLPESLVSDLYQTDKPVCWLGQNIAQLAERDTRGELGFRLEAAPDTESYGWVSYGGQSLRRAPSALVGVSIARPEVCETIALAEGIGPPIPYAVRSGRFWYFADVVLEETRQAVQHFVLCDQLHEILGQPHAAERRVLLRVADVTPYTDARSLGQLIEYLRGEDLPFAISVSSRAGDAAGATAVRLSDRRSLAHLLRSAQRAGAAIVAQRCPRASPESAEQDEALAAAPASEPGQITLGRQIDETVQELVGSGLFPLAWAGCMGPASASDCAEMASRCSTVVRRGRGDAQSPDLGIMPFITQCGAGATRVISEDLSLSSYGSAHVDDLLEALRPPSVISDPWVSLSLPPDAAVEAVEVLVAGLREMDYEFVDLRRVTNRVKVGNLEVVSAATARTISDVLGQERHGLLLGPEAGMLERFQRPGRDQRSQVMLEPGAVLVAHPAGTRLGRPFGWEGGGHRLAEEAVAAIARIAVVFAVCAAGLLAIIYLVQISLQRRGHG